MGTKKRLRTADCFTTQGGFAIRLSGGEWGEMGRDWSTHQRTRTHQKILL